MNIVLTGFMGTGKTEIGRALAGNLGWAYADTDELIEKKAGLKIKLIFEKYGEEHFRRLEEETVKNIGELNNHVISTGGGVVLRSVNMDNLEKNGFIVNLYASPGIIFDRIKGSDDRPLLNKPYPQVEIARLIRERERFYERCDMRVNTDSSNVERFVEQIIEGFNRAL